MLLVVPVLRAQRGFSGWTALAVLLSLHGLPVRAESTPSGNDVIEDPELAAIAPPPRTPSQPLAEQDGEVRVVLRSRVGMDLQWQDAREDVWEATQIALFEARVKRSERLRFEIGVRGRHMFASRQRATVDAGARRYELDVAPTAAYADIGVSDAVHLRLGYQLVHLGRFDILNPSDILSVHDLRSGPTTMPEASAIAQPAARLDWDAAGWLSFTAIALPFFEAHRVNVLDGDYALVPAKQRDIDALNAQTAANPSGFGSLQSLVRSTLSRSGQSRLGDSALSAFAPDANLAHAQGALRVVAHGPSGELGLTAGTALEHLPALRFSDAFLAYSRNASADTMQALLTDRKPLTVLYNRFGLTSVDASAALGPIQIGAELAYMFGRTLFAGQLGELPVAERSDMAHAGLRAEYTESDHVLFAFEAAAARALRAPSDPNRHFMFLSGGRFMLSAVGFMAFSPGDVGLKLELGAGVLNGRSYLIAPRIEQRLASGLAAEAGAFLIGGRTPGPFGDPGVALGGLYGNTDQVFVGLRWQP